MKDSFQSLSKTELEKMRHEISAGIAMVRTTFKKRAMFDADTATKVFDAGLTKLNKALAEIDLKLTAKNRSHLRTALNGHAVQKSASHR